jgi:hypothetical protein
MDRRDEFLAVMYGKMWDNINRHLTVVWEAAAIIAGAVALFALTENDVVSLDVASALIVTIAGWAVLHAYDANSWYNRNLAIIANIERVFLRPDDDRNIHYFFRRHRKFQLLEHLRIHAFLGGGIGALTLLYHFSVRVWPGFNAPLRNFEPQRGLPYVAAVLVIVAVTIFRRHYVTKHNEFDEKSPGIAVPDAPDSEGDRQRPLGSQ